MKKVLIAVALTLALFALNTRAQDAGGPPPADGGGPGPKPGFHLLPPHAVEQLKLTDDQKKQVADLEAETKAKLEKILTAEQLDQLKQMRPPQRQGQGQGGSGGSQLRGQRGGGPGGNGPDGEQGGRPPGPSAMNRKSN